MKGRPGSSQERAKILDITNNSSTDEWSPAMLQHCSCCLSLWRYNVPHYAYRFRNKKLGGGGYVGRDLSSNCAYFSVCPTYKNKPQTMCCVRRPQKHSLSSKSSIMAPIPLPTWPSLLSLKPLPPTCAELHYSILINCRAFHRSFHQCGKGCCI